MKQSKLRPIIFSGPMVRALMNGRKSQTRRIVKDASQLTVSGCPYGQPGDLLWVKEAFKRQAGGIVWRADDPDGAGPWTSPLFLRLQDSRVWLELTDISYQPLLDIDEPDAMREGLPSDWHETPIAWFKAQWQAINGTASWNSNPLVWVLGFRLVDKMTTKQLPLTANN